MRRPDIGKVVYDFIWQDPRACDPGSWEDFIRPNGHIAKEVQEERRRFYGPPPNPSIQSLGYPLEAQYPGMDYNNPWHRMRLSIGCWHKILFKALDTLELTPDEIDAIMTFKGTKFEREQFEMKHGVVIKDTTGDELRPFVEPFLALHKSSARVSRMAPLLNLDGDYGPREAVSRMALRLDVDAGDGSTEAATSEDEDQEEDPLDNANDELGSGSQPREMSLDSIAAEDDEVEDRNLDTELPRGPEEDDDEDEHMDSQESDGNPTPPQPASPRPVYLVQSFEEFVAQRLPQNQFPNGLPPTPYRVLYTADEILVEDTNETVMFAIRFSDLELEYWRQHASEHEHPMCNEGTLGAAVWRIPRYVSRVFLECKGDTNAALEVISQADFYEQEDPRARTDYLVAHVAEEDDDDEDSDMSDEELTQAPRPTSMSLYLDAEEGDDDECEESDMNDNELSQAPHSAAAPVQLDTDEEDNEDNDMDADVVINPAYVRAQLRGLSTPADFVRSMARRVRRRSSDSVAVLRQINERIYTPEHTGARRLAALRRHPTIRGTQ